MSATPRLAVMISGGGRTLLNLHEVIGREELAAEIALVVASRECEGAARARALGLSVIIEPGEIPAARLESLLRTARAGWVVLAGYLRRVRVPASYRGRVVNIHPSLLPSHGGAGMWGQRVHEAVLRAGDAESGCTVHLVDEEFDSGPVVLRRACPVLPGDTPQTLAARVFEVECEAYPEALRQLFAKRTGNAGV